jgi:hypothetical protein
MAESVVKLHALRRVGNFSGDEDVEQWIDRIEMALRIDSIPTDKHADVISLHLEQAAYQTWKGMPDEKKIDAAAIKAELRAVYGLQRITAWVAASSRDPLEPGDTVDVAFENIKRLVGIAAAGGDTVGRISACILIDRLPAAIKGQVLLQCGKELEPSAVVSCTKQLMANSVSSGPAFSAVIRQSPATRRPTIKNNQQQASVYTARDEHRRCFSCHQVGHLFRDCTSRGSHKTTVSGNAGGGQLLE